MKLLLFFQTQLFFVSSVFLLLIGCSHLKSNSAMGPTETLRGECFEKMHNEKKSIIASLPVPLKRLIGNNLIIREYTDVASQNLAEDLKRKEFITDDLGPWGEHTLITQIVRNEEFIDSINKTPIQVVVFKVPMGDDHRIFYFPLHLLKNYKEESIGVNGATELKIKQLDRFHTIIKLSDHQNLKNNFAALVRSYDKKSYELNDRLFDYDPIYDFEYSDQECDDI